MLKEAMVKPSLHELAAAVGRGVAAAEQASSPVAVSPSRNLKKEGENLRPHRRGHKAAEPEFSGDDTCSTNVSDDECQGHGIFYGFNLDALDEGVSTWQLENNPPWQHQDNQEFSRFTSAGSVEESWQSCVEGGFSRSVTEQIDEVIEEIPLTKARATCALVELTGQFSSKSFRKKVDMLDDGKQPPLQLCSAMKGCWDTLLATGVKDLAQPLFAMVLPTYGFPADEIGVRQFWNSVQPLAASDTKLKETANKVLRKLLPSTREVIEETCDTPIKPPREVPEEAQPQKLDAPSSFDEKAPTSAAAPEQPSGEAAAPACPGCGFDFDDLPAIPGTVLDVDDPAAFHTPMMAPLNASAGLAAEPFELETCHEVPSSSGFLFDLDALPPIPGTVFERAESERCDTDSAAAPKQSSEEDVARPCSGCGFDFDDLPAIPGTVLEFSPKAEAGGSADVDFAEFEKDRAQTCAEGFGFDFDDLPPLPHTTDTPTTASARSSESSASTSHSEELRPLLPLPTQRRQFLSKPKVGSMGCRVAVVLNGSVGDVQPLVALAKQLELFRHRVRVFTTSNLVKWVRNRGLDAVPVFADSQAVINEMGGMVKGMAEGMSLGNKAAHSWMADHKTSCLDPEESLKCFGPQAIVCGIQALGLSFSFEKKTGVPVIPVFLSLTAYEAFADYATIKPSRLSIMSVSSFLENWVRKEKTPAGLCFTEEFVLHEVPEPDDLERDKELARLRRFLGTGKPPVAVGWGSMIPSGMKPVEMLGLALRALQAAGARGVIMGGWAKLDELFEELLCGRLPELGPDASELRDFAARDVCFVSSAPHEWLFPQCSLVVQHGGVGTWQAAIRSGKPAVVTPIFADQFPHSATIERMGLGIGFKKSLQQIEAQELANAIILAEAKAVAADAVGQKMRAKVGERDAAVLIDNCLRQKKGADSPARRLCAPSSTGRSRH